MLTRTGIAPCGRNQMASFMKVTNCLFGYERAGSSSGKKLLNYFCVVAHRRTSFCMSSTEGSNKRLGHFSVL